MNFVLYLTKRCNMRCSYCFEKDILTNDHKDDMTMDQVERFIDFALKEDPNGTLILFGGEPFVTDLVFKILEYNNNRLKIQIYTNGLNVDNDTLVKLTKYKLNLGISYDCSYNYRRSRTSKIPELLFKCKKLRERGLLDFSISYTVRKDNFDDFIPDIKLLQETFNPQKIEISFDTVQLGKDYYELCEEFQAKDLGLKGAVCSINCHKCKQCEKGESMYWHCYKDKIIKGTNMSSLEIFK